MEDIMFHMKLNNSPTSKVQYNGFTFYVKRDDLLDSRFNGNKARKLYSFLTHSLDDIDTIISYGGVQSNAMYAISELAKLKQKKFIYYIKQLNKTIQVNNTSNYLLSVQNGMQTLELLNNYTMVTQNLSAKPHELIIKQGGAEDYAKHGLQQLANEINDWFISNNFKKLNVFIASGTGTSAIYLQQYLHHNITLYTANCVGSPEYLFQQWNTLGFYSNYPQILANTKYRFANLYPELLITMLNIQQQTNIEFDLLYDSVSFQLIMENLPIFTDKPFLYIHCGGTVGNHSMLQRYAHLAKK